MDERDPLPLRPMPAERPFTPPGPHWSTWILPPATAAVFVVLAGMLIHRARSDAEAPPPAAAATQALAAPVPLAPPPAAFADKPRTPDAARPHKARTERNERNERAAKRRKPAPEHRRASPTELPQGQG